MTKDEARKQFPHLKNGLIYFNHASSAPISISVSEKLKALIEEKSETNIDDFKSFLRSKENVKEKLARLINSTPDRIAFTDNTSNGINILAQGINWQSGDRILLNDAEFPANVYPYLNLTGRNVKIDFIRSNNGIVSAEQIINECKEGTRLISISLVQFLSGYMIDLEPLGKFCKKNGIILAVDAIQGLGAVKLDVIKDNIDFISCGTQKWLLGLQGCGFIYISKELQEKISQINVGWLSVKNAWDLLDYELTFRSSAERFNNGTLNTFGIFVLEKSLELFFEFGIDEIENNVKSNSDYFIRGLVDLGIEPIMKDQKKNNLSGIVSFKNSKCESIVSKLAEEKIFCSAREGLVRFSPHFYNSPDDIDIVLSELKNFI